MSFRIFNSVDMVVVIDDSTWEVQKFPLDNIWYQYDNLEAPILYSVYQINPERKLVLEQPYTAFKNSFGDVFDTDVLLQAYLDEVLSSKETINITPLPVEDDQLRTLIEILEQQTITNKYLRKIYNPK